MTDVVMTYIVMPSDDRRVLCSDMKYSYGVYTYNLCSYDLYSYDLHVMPNDGRWVLCSDMPTLSKPPLTYTEGPNYIDHYRS